jgi:hypothetical protein
MIHYHGTPITPRADLLTMAGRHFCVSYSAPRDIEPCLEIGASVMLDNGAFSAWTRGQTPSWAEFYRWATQYLGHPHWAVIPDVIDGDEEQNDALLAECPLPRPLAAPVWHLHESIDRLLRLADAYPRLCFGSSGDYRTPGTPGWRARVDVAWEALTRTGRTPWVHMLRAMREASRGPWPFASADSTNIARNHLGSSRCPPVHVEVMADRIDRRNPKATRIT